MPARRLCWMGWPVALLAATSLVSPAAALDVPVRRVPGGTLRELPGMRILELEGSPEQMGRAHGELLGGLVRWVTNEVIHPERWRRIRAAVELMERFQPPRFRRELAALAKASGVEYMRMVALQLFGDAERFQTPDWQLPSPTDDLPPRPGQLCTAYAVFGPATRTGECIVGRNFDYWPESVARAASTIIYFKPEGARPFVTLTWAGIINGWTLMNDAGLCAANNSVIGPDESPEGVSTCFVLRYIVENAASVDEGIELVRSIPRAIGTAMLLAGGSPPDAAVVEFDHSSLVVRRAEAGYVLAANTLRALGRASVLPDDEFEPGRYGRLFGLIRANYGRIDRSMNFAAARGVPIEEINLHCALLFPQDLSFSVSMGEVPAYRGTFRRFRMAPGGIELLD